MEFTNGMLIFIGSVGAFSAFLIFWLVFLIVTGRKMKKILKSNEKPEE